jgi:hypothetical protein
MSRLRPLATALLCAALATAPVAARAQDAKSGAAPAAPAGATAGAQAGAPGAAPGSAAAPAKAAPAGKDAAAKAGSPGADPKRKKTAAEKDCESATKKAAKEQGYLDGVVKSIDSKKRAMPDCTTKWLCKRFEADLAYLGKSKAKHEKRLADFTAKRDKVCAAAGKG